MSACVWPLLKMGGRGAGFNGLPVKFLHIQPCGIAQGKSSSISTLRYILIRRVNKGGPPSWRPCCDVGARQPRRQPGRAKQAVSSGERERERAGLHNFNLEGAAGDVVIAPLDDHHVVSAVLDHVVDLVKVAAKVLDEHLVTGSLGPIHTGVDEVVAGV